MRKVLHLGKMLLSELSDKSAKCLVTIAIGVNLPRQMWILKVNASLLIVEALDWILINQISRPSLSQLTSERRICL